MGRAQLINASGGCRSRQRLGLKNSGFVIVLDKNNKVISCPGGSTPEYKDGKLEPMTQASETFLHVHDLCIDRDGNIFVVQWNAQGAYPIKLERLQ